MSYRQSLLDRIGVPVTQHEVRNRFGVTACVTAGDGYPVVCLHGAGAGLVTWYPTIAAIAGQFLCVAPDIVGYGESDKPDARYDRPYFSAWLHDFLASMAIDRAHVIGLSQGGAIALQFVLDHPHRVDKLVLVDAGGLGAQPTFWPMLGMIWMNTLPSAVANRFNARYLLFDPANRDPNHGLYSIEVLKKAGGRNAFTQGRGAAVSALPADALRSIEHETLVIWGENDRLFPVHAAEDAVRLMPNATLHRIGNAGHLPLMDQPETFNRTVMAFLGERNPST